MAAMAGAERNGNYRTLRALVRLGLGLFLGLFCTIYLIYNLEQKVKVIFIVYLRNITLNII